MAPKWFPLPSQIFFRRYEIQRTLNVIKENPPEESAGRRVGAAIEGCDVALVRSCSLFEPEMLNFVEKEIYQKPTIPIGAIPPCIIHQGILLEVDDDDEEKWVEISEWLNKMKPESVVYVAIGSEASLNQEEINELALGLELSNLPFFWVLRKAVDDEKVELPDGFKGRTMGRGLVWKGWAPQVKILAHPSIAGFLTHCGWNSTIEGLVFGRALILFPCLWEQGLNARLMEESKKLGVEIEREERDGSFTRGSVAKALRMVMVEEEGEDVRRNAREMKEHIFGNKELHNRYMDTLVKYLKDHKRKDESHGYE